MKCSINLGVALFYTQLKHSETLHNSKNRLAAPDLCDALRACIADALRQLFMHMFAAFDLY
jgi:hypothetical protein